MTNPLTDAELDDLLRLRAAATPGNQPSERFTSRAVGWCSRTASGGTEVYGDNAEGCRASIALVDRTADAAIIVAAVNALPRLVAEIKRLRAAILEGHLAHCNAAHAVGCLIHEIEPS